MAQTFDNIVDTISGSALAVTLNAWKNAILSGHSGEERPSYVVAGSCWYNSISKINYFYDGTSDIPLFTADTTNHLLNPPIGGGTATLSSAATVDLGSVPQSALSITGTATITSFGTSMLAGQSKVVTFSGALTLTHNGTSLICPAATNITTVAGDTAIVLCLSTGNYRIVSYFAGLRTYAGAQRGSVVTLTSSGGVVAIDASLGNYFTLALTEDCVLGAPSNMVEGQSIEIKIIQHPSAAKTAGYNAAFKFTDGVTPAVSTTLGAVNLLSGYATSSTTITSNLAKHGVA